jgi:hypothetical protein
LESYQSALYWSLSSHSRDKKPFTELDFIRGILNQKIKDDEHKKRRAEYNLRALPEIQANGSRFVGVSYSRATQLELQKMADDLNSKNPRPDLSTYYVPHKPLACHGVCSGTVEEVSTEASYETEYTCESSDDQDFEDTEQDFQ